MNREQFRDKIDQSLDLPLALLAIIALVLIIIDLIAVIEAPYRFAVEVAFWLIWSIFILEYLIKLLLSDDKLLYFRTHLIDLTIAVLPFLRILRILRVVRITRSAALLRFFLFTRQGLSELEKILTRRITYLTFLTVFMIFFGAIGAFILESRAPGATIITFGDALWWSSSLVATFSAEDIFPVTAAGRILGFILMIYAVIVFSYLAASIAAFLIEKDTGR